MGKAVVSDKDFLQKLLENISTGLKKTEEEFTIEELNARLEELGQEMMGLVSLNARAGTGTSTYEDEYMRYRRKWSKSERGRQQLLRRSYQR